MSLPRVIFVKEEKDGGVTYLVAAYTRADVAVAIGDPAITVGLYSLAQTDRVETVAQVVPNSTRRKR